MMKKEQNAACKINRELGLRKCCKTYKNNYKCSYKHEVEATDRYILVALVSSCWSRSKSLMSLWWQWTIAQQFLTNSASLSRWTSALDSFVPAGSVAVKINSNTQLPTSLVQLLSMLATWYYPHSPVACHAALCWQRGTTHTRPWHAMLLCARATINRYLLQAALWPMLRQTDGGQTDAYTLLCISCEQCQ